MTRRKRPDDVQLIPVPKMARHHRRAKARALLKDSPLQGEKKARAAVAIARQMAQGYILARVPHVTWRKRWLNRLRRKRWERRQLRISRRINRQIARARSGSGSG